MQAGLNCVTHIQIAFLQRVKVATPYLSFLFLCSQSKAYYKQWLDASYKYSVADIRNTQFVH